MMLWHVIVYVYSHPHVLCVYLVYIVVYVCYIISYEYKYI